MYRFQSRRYLAPVPTCYLGFCAVSNRVYKVLEAARKGTTHAAEYLCIKEALGISKLVLRTDFDGFTFAIHVDMARAANDFHE